MPNKERAIGVFDSGIGGLTVLHKIIETLPNENTVYLGDTARAPYGTKSLRLYVGIRLRMLDSFLKKMSNW
jgi:glutamate racemase